MEDTGFKLSHDTLDQLQRRGREDRWFDFIMTTTMTMMFFQRRGDRIQHNFLHNGGVWRADWWYSSLCRYCYRWYEQVLNMTIRDGKLKCFNSGVMKILKFQSVWSYTASETAPYQVYLITNANNPEKNIKILHTWSLGALFLSLLASWLPPLHLRPCDQRRKPVTPPHRNT